MTGDYPVYYGKQEIGKVQIQLQGLYYRIQCSCRMTGDTVSCLFLCSGNRRKNLGVLIPGKAGFVLDRKIPVKQLPETEPGFFVAPHPERMEGKFVPIIPEEPFHYIARLKESALICRQGQAGILVREDT